MEKKMLFPQVKGLLHGGDYNPDQWLDRPDILAEDIKLMKKAGVNSATLGVFAWASYEPAEGEFHFDWLEDIINNLYENGIYTVLATPSGARPAWLDAKYPEAMRVGADGVRAHHGWRHNHCMSSPVYREKTAIIDRRLAERFAHHPGVMMWHISNEFGGECYCPYCQKRFQEYLAEKYDHDIEKLNTAWWTSFWSHHYNDFTQIEPPFLNGERSVMGLNLEWKRFTTWSMTDFMKWEIEVLREVNPAIPVTTNFMQLFGGLDYRVMARELDVISWDSYPRFHNDYESFADTMRQNAFDHAVMRSMKKDKPFMLMESAPGLANWHDYNKMKRPGVHKLASLQAVASGSDTVQYFQWRKGRGSYEQFHGAVLDHLGTDNTRIFREVADLGEAMKKLAPVAGTCVKTKAALLFDWDNRWAIQDSMALEKNNKKYEETCLGIWKQFSKMGVEMDVISSDDAFDDYRVIVAPMLYMLHPGTAGRLRTFTAEGGQLLATYFTGYVDTDQLCFLGGFPGDGLSEVFGLISEEIDTLYPGDSNHIRFSDDSGICPGAACEVKDYAEYLQVRDAEVLAVYLEDYYKDCAAVTRKAYGKGNAYYVAARIAPEDMAPIFARMLEEARIPMQKLPEQVGCYVRTGEEGVYSFYLNYSKEPVTVESVQGYEMLTERETAGTLSLESYGVAVVRSNPS